MRRVRRPKNGEYRQPEFSPVPGSGGVALLQAPVVPAPPQRTRRNGAPTVLANPSEIKSLGHPPGD
jgi:hypothetical protein